MYSLIKRIHSKHLTNRPGSLISNLVFTSPCGYFLETLLILRWYLKFLDSFRNSRCRFCHPIAAKAFKLFLQILRGFPRYHLIYCTFPNSVNSVQLFDRYCWNVILVTPYYRHTFVLECYKIRIKKYKIPHTFIGAIFKRKLFYFDFLSFKLLEYKPYFKQAKKKQFALSIIYLLFILLVWKCIVTDQKIKRIEITIIKSSSVSFGNTEEKHHLKRIFMVRIVLYEFEFFSKML